MPPRSRSLCSAFKSAYLRVLEAEGFKATQNLKSQITNLKSKKILQVGI
jgi:hypothetical protein